MTCINYYILLTNNLNLRISHQIIERESFNRNISFHVYINSAQIITFVINVSFIEHVQIFMYGIIEQETYLYE